MNKINCFGDICPIPILRIKKELKNIDENESFLIVIDHSCVVESIKDYLKNKNHLIYIDEVMNGVWEITITKKM